MGIKVIATNKRAGFDYQLFDKFEAGIVLQGTEVKSLRAGKVKINESFVTIETNQEAYLHNMNIAHYEFGNRANHEEGRKRKLLLQKSEIEQLEYKSRAEGLTIIPVKLYFKGRYVKIEIALAKGKKLYDKRQDIAKKDMDRKIKQGKYD